MFSISFNVEQTITINKPVAEVYTCLGDFNQWRVWSPWIIQEPECPVKITNDPVTLGHQQEWNGTRIGSGRMTLIEKTDDARLAYDLEFLAPWKSQSKTQFEFQATKDENGNDATHVTWLMQGTLPFFLFFMKKMMTAFVGSDYSRGLKMLKEYMETGRVTSTVDISGITQQGDFHYVGYRVECKQAEIGERVGPMFEKLMNADVPQPDMVLTIVNKFDMVTQDSDMIAAIAYKQKPTFDIPSDMVAGYVPSHQALEVIHNGGYDYMANGWSTLINNLQFNKLKAHKKIKEYEVYLNSPQDVPPEELKTAIYAPLR
mgnify:CR=1 FL=1